MQVLVDERPSQRAFGRLGEAVERLSWRHMGWLVAVVADREGASNIRPGWFRVVGVVFLVVTVVL